MPELRVTIPEKLDELLDSLVDSGLFSTKAELVRMATVAYLKEHGWISPDRTHA